jgi:hypothetical protein
MSVLCSIVSKHERTSTLAKYSWGLRADGQVQSRGCRHQGEQAAVNVQRAIGESRATIEGAQARIDVVRAKDRRAKDLWLGGLQKVEGVCLSSAPCNLKTQARRTL